MKKYIILIAITLTSFLGFTQNAYQDGEFFKFQISYGFINAGVATLHLKETTYNGKKVYHAKGHEYFG